MERVPSESDIKTYPQHYTEYLLSGEIIGELNCLTKERMQYSATCKTVVEVGALCFCLAVAAHAMPGFKSRILLVLRGQCQCESLSIGKVKEHALYITYYMLYNIHALYIII